MSTRLAQPARQKRGDRVRFHILPTGLALAASVPMATEREKADYLFDPGDAFGAACDARPWA
jgi:hypothetical protein